MLRVEVPLTHTLSSVDIDSDYECGSPSWATPADSEPVDLAVHVRVGGLPLPAPPLGNCVTNNRPCLWVRRVSSVRVVTGKW